MDYFGLDHEIESLEGTLRGRHHHHGRAALTVQLAWYLRRRDTNRAMRLAEEAHELLVDPRPTQGPAANALSARLLLVQGECHWLYGELASAEKILTQARRAFDEVGDAIGAGDTSMALAAMHNDMGRPQDCRDALKAALRAFTTTGDTTRLQLAQARMAHQDSYRNLDEGWRRWGAFLEAASRHEHPGVRGAAMTALGYYAFESDASRALHHLKAAHDCLLAAGDRHGAAMQATNVGAGLQNMHIYDIALEWMERAYEITKSTGWERVLAWCKVQMAVVLTEVGRYALARTMLHESRATLAAPPGRAYAHACWYLGQLCLKTQEHTEALELMAQTEQLGHQLGNSDMVLHGIRGQAEALSLAHRPAEAMETARRGLARARDISCAWQETLALEALAAICREHRAHAAPGAVIDYLEAALAAAAKTNGYGVKPAVYSDLSQEYEAQGDWQRALACERQAAQAREASQAKRAADLALVTQLRRDKEQVRIESARREVLTLAGPPQPAPTAPAAPAAPGKAEALLHAASLALESGSTLDAVDAVRSALRLARMQDDVQLEARALVLMARADRRECRMRQAHETGSRAAQLFQRSGDAVGETSALATVSLACASLGRHEEAVEAALLSTRLAESLPFGRQRVLTTDHLGMAYAWAWRFDEAAAAFQRSARNAATCSPPASELRPRLHHAMSEALRVLLIRCTTGEPPPFDRLDDSLQACAGPMAVLQARPENGLAAGVTQAVWHLAWGLRHAWAGRLDPAQAELEAADVLLLHQGRRTSAQVMAAWLRAELALAHGDLDDTEIKVEALIAVSQQLEHEQMVMLARLFASQLLERQAKCRGALGHLQELLAHEWETRSEALDNRHDVVQWQLEMRNHRALAELEARRVQALEAAHDTLRTLGTVGNEITATLDPSAVFEALHRYTGELLDMTSLSIHLLEGQQLVMRFGMEDGLPLPDATVALDDAHSQAASCIRARQLLVLDRSTVPADTGSGARWLPSAMFAPLISGDRVLGALVVQSWREGAYNERERQVFRTLAAYGSVAIANALGAQDLADAHAELERQRMRNTLAHAGKLVSMGQLASGIVHELSHPVGAISLSLGVMKSLWHAGDTAQAADLLPELEHEVHRLRGLIQRLRRLARSDPPRVAPTALRTALDDARKMFGPRLNANAVVYEESVPELVVQADLELLSLAIANLVANAIDAMAACDTRRISLRAWQDEEQRWVHMTITDTGPGLPAHVIDNLFKPFVTTKPDDQGLGLGLALCAEYLAAMGAQVHGANLPGGGAEFRLKLASVG